MDFHKLDIVLDAAQQFLRIEQSLDHPYRGMDDEQLKELEEAIKEIAEEV